MADEYTPTSWVDGVPPYIDAEHLNKIEAELVRLGTQVAAIKAAYLGKSAISNVQVNDQNKVPSSALVYGMNEDISELNSNFGGMKLFSSLPPSNEPITDLKSLVKALPGMSILIGGTDLNDFAGLSLADVNGNTPDSGNGLLEIIKYSTSRTTIRISRCVSSAKNSIISQTHYVSSDDSIAPWITVVTTDYKNLTLKDGVGAANNNHGGRKSLGYSNVGNHVFISGGVSITDFQGSMVVAEMPEGLRPASNHYYFAPLSSSRIARAFVTAGGDIRVEWIYNITTGEAYTGAVTWIDLTTCFPIS